MFREQFYIYKNVLYQGVNLEGGSVSIPTLILDKEEYLNGLLEVINMLLGIYNRVTRIKFLKADIFMYILEIDDDIILIYPNGVDKILQESFLEIVKEDLFELSNLLVSQICDFK